VYNRTAFKYNTKKALLEAWEGDALLHGKSYPWVRFSSPSSVGACCTFSVRFTLMVDISEVPSLLVRSGKIAHEGSGKGGSLVGIDACSRTLLGLVVHRTRFTVSARFSHMDLMTHSGVQA
jgi:hypothetical protein